MTVQVTSIELKRLEGYRVNTEVQVKDGIESIIIVGLPDASVIFLLLVACMVRRTVPVEVGHSPIIHMTIN